MITSLIISFCGLVYNEFLILFCCGLERDTHDQVSFRSDFENCIEPFYNDNDIEYIEENENEEAQEEGELFKLGSMQTENKWYMNINNWFKILFS